MMLARAGMLTQSLHVQCWLCALLVWQACVRLRLCAITCQACVQCIQAGHAACHGSVQRWVGGRALTWQCAG